MSRLPSEYSIQDASAKLGVPVQKLRRWDSVSARPIEEAVCEEIDVRSLPTSFTAADGHQPVAKRTLVAGQP